MDKKGAILRNAWRCANHPDFKKLGFSPDRTLQERKDDIERRSELAERRAKGEKNIKISRGKIVSTAPTQTAAAGENKENCTV